MLGRDMRLGPALDFVTFEALVQLGWKLPVRSAQLLAGIAYALVIPAVAASVIVLAALARAGLQTGAAGLDERAWIVVVTLVLLNVYLTGVYWFRETFSKRRFAVGGSPNTALLRALDIPALSMFVAACAVRTVLVFSLAAVATLAVVAVFIDVIDPALAAALLLVPVASGIGMLALGARFAARNTRVRPRIRARYVLAVIPLMVGCGSFAAQAIAATGAIERDAETHTFVIGQSASVTALVLIGLLLALSAVALRRAVRELRRRSFEIEQAATAARPATAAAPRGLIAVLHRELRSAKQYFLLQRSALVLALAVAFLVGLRAGGGGLMPIESGHELWIRAALLLTFLSALTAAEVVLNVCGPLTLRNQLRYAWDCGAPVPRMLPAAVAYWILPSVLIATATTAAIYLLLGQLVLSPLAVGAATAAAALLAGALSVVPRSHADGSSDTSLFVALLTVVLSAPVLAVSVYGDAVLTAVAQLYVLVLIGGATAWTARRIRFLPSSSPA